MSRGVVVSTGAVMLALTGGTALAYVSTPGHGYAQGFIDAFTTPSPRPTSSRPNSGTGGVAGALPGSDVPEGGPPETVVVRLSSPFDPQRLCTAWPGFAPVNEPDDTAAEYAAERVVVNVGGPVAVEPTDLTGAAQETDASEATGVTVAATPAVDACQKGAAATVSVGATAAVPMGLATDGTGYPATMTLSQDGLTVTFALAENVAPVSGPSDHTGSPSETGTSTPATSTASTKAPDPSTSPTDSTQATPRTSTPNSDTGTSTSDGEAATVHAPGTSQTAKSTS